MAAAITEIPGSSEVLLGGLVTYSNESKHDLLRVSNDVLDTFGAVSVATAWSMAQGALEATQPILLFCVAFGLSTDYGVFLLTRIKEARDGGLGDVV